VYYKPHRVAFSTLTLQVGRQEEHPVIKTWGQGSVCLLTVCFCNLAGLVSSTQFLSPLHQ